MDSVYRNIRLCLFIIVSLSLITNPSYSALQKPSRLAKTLVPKRVLYNIQNEDLKSIKDSFVKINLHLRENSDQIKPETMIAIYGPGVQFFRKSSVDSELKYILRWFYDEEIVVGVSKLWLDKLNLYPEDLFEGISILEFRPTSQ